ncbi:MAG: hypothetical protein JXQ99_27145 [Hyphomicrobiaceae bacterium]
MAFATLEIEEDDMSSMRRKFLARRRRVDPAARPEPAEARARIEAAFQKDERKLPWVMPSVIAIWLLAGAYYFLMPSIYHSNWSLILPVSSSGSTVSLETIGQTTSSPSQPFGSVSLSPKVIYKEIAASDQVREEAAKKLGLTTREFGKARVKLIDETSLMNFRMSAKSPEMAQAKARALLTAFESQLDVLRRDEIDRRSAFSRKNLDIYRANLKKARQRMVKFKRSTGLQSIEQFKETSLSAELLRRKLAEERGERERLMTLHKTLLRRVGLTTAQAAEGVRLASDPAFESLAKVYGKNRAEVSESNLRFGPNHPKFVIMRMKADGALNKLRRIALDAGLSSSENLHKLVMVASNSNQSDLFREILGNESKLAGKRDAVLALESQLGSLEQTIKDMGKHVARLEALQKEHLVAEAVYTSAAARLDIGRTDLFESYPMVQVLAQPSLPVDRSQPRLSYAVAAGLLGTLFILMAWGAAWVRSKFSLKQ